VTGEGQAPQINLSIVQVPESTNAPLADQVVASNPGGPFRSSSIVTGPLAALEAVATLAQAAQATNRIRRMPSYSYFDPRSPSVVVNVNITLNVDGPDDLLEVLRRLGLDVPVRDSSSTSSD
jgi:hypothetical protein